MSDQPAFVPSAGLRAANRFGPWLIVLLILLFTGAVRVRLLSLPLERDEGEYAYAGQLLLQGVPPYELAYNMKLPGSYFALAAGMAIFGKTISGVHLTLLAANSAASIFVFLLGRRLFGTTAGLVSCASYSVMSLSPAVAGLAAHATQFVVLFAVPATLLLWKFGESGRPCILFWSGLLYGMAFLMKQQGICFVVFGGLVLFWFMAEHRWTPRSAAKRFLLFVLGAVLPFGLVCLGLAASGVFGRFWFWTFTYAASYAAALPLQEGLANLTGHMKSTFDLSAGLWLLAGIGFAAVAIRKLRRAAGFTALLWLASFAGTAIGLYFRPHYFVLMLPAFSLLLGMAICWMQRALQVKTMPFVFQSLPLILFGAILAWVVFYQSLVFFQMSPVRVCRTLYASNPFVESEMVSDYLRDHSAPGARVAVIGSEPEIYFESQRRSATGYIYTYALMEQQRDALKMQKEMIQEIETARPEYLVYVSYNLSWLFQPLSDHTLLRWFDDFSSRNYDCVGFVRPGSSGQINASWRKVSNGNAGIPPGEYLSVFRRKTDGQPARP